MVLNSLSKPPLYICSNTLLSLYTIYTIYIISKKNRDLADLKIVQGDTMRDFDLTLSKEEAINIECRTDKGINLGIGDGIHYTQVIVKNEDVLKLAAWLMDYIENNIKVKRDE
jgi:hypothetical protein